MNDQQNDPKAKRLYEAREAFKSIVGAIVNSIGIDNMNAAQLRVVLDVVHTAWEFAGDQLNQVDNAEWRETNDGRSETA